MPCRLPSGAVLWAADPLEPPTKQRINASLKELAHSSKNFAYLVDARLSTRLLVDCDEACESELGLLTITAKQREYPSTVGRIREP